MFAPTEKGYSAPVNKRRDAGITSIANVLNLTSPRVATPVVPGVPIRSFEILGDAHPLKTPQQLLFEVAANEMVTTYKTKTQKQYPELWHWHIERLNNGG